MKEIATELKVENVDWAVAVGSSPSLLKVDQDQRPHSRDVADDLKKRRHRQLSCNYGTTKTGTWHHPVAMLHPFQTCDKFRHREGIRRRTKIFFAGIVSGDANWILGTQPACDCTHFPNTRLSVSQHMRLTRNSNKDHWTIHSSHNWPEHSQIVCGITERTVWNSPGNSMEDVLLRRSYEGPQCHSTLLDIQTVQTVSLIATKHAWQNSG